jgi:hypothetical protein
MPGPLPFRGFYLDYIAERRQAARRRGHGREFCRSGYRRACLSAEPRDRVASGAGRSWRRPGYGRRLRRILALFFGDLIRQPGGQNSLVGRQPYGEGEEGGPVELFLGVTDSVEHAQVRADIV